MHSLLIMLCLRRVNYAFTNLINELVTDKNVAYQQNVNKKQKAICHLQTNYRKNLDQEEFHIKLPWKQGFFNYIPSSEFKF